MMQGLIFASIAASAAIVIILLLRKFFKDKVYSKVFVLLWALVILRLLLPFEFSSALSIYPSETEFSTPMREDNVQIQREVLPEYDNAVFPTEYEVPEEPAKTAAKISFADALFGIWLLGAVSVGGYFVLCHFRTVRKIETDCAPMEDIPNDFSTEKTRFLKSKNLASPLSFGIFKPTAVIPENISAELLPFVLLHEHTHIKDRDAALKTLAVFALALHWFNPLVWVMVKYLDRDIERYCDERVLSVIGSKKAARYANAILDFAERESISASLSFFSAASLEERVISIMKNKTKRGHLPAVIAVFTATLLIMTACGTTPEPEKPKEALSGKEISELGTSVLEDDEEKLFLNYAYFQIADDGGFDYENTGNVEEIPSGENDLEAEKKELENTIEDIEGSAETPNPAEEAEEIDNELQNTIEFVWPCGAITVTSPMEGRPNHTGIDIGFEYDEDIYAAAIGVVVELVENDTSYGNYLVIDHGDGIKTLYAHCSEICVTMGEYVEAGQLIAKTGSTGNSTGPHLHFEIILEGENVDPMKYLGQ